MKITCLYFAVFFSIYASAAISSSLRTVEGNRVIYRLTVDYKDVNFSGKDRKAMLVNGSLPAPTLYFKEGEKAVVYVTNKMDVDTSIHWHGILLPNFQDGVPYLTTPPIKPGQTHKFEFPLRQSGTYWYHSHTRLQEQRGVFGAIVIEPKQKDLQYDRDLVFVLSDWTDEDPKEVLRSLKRGNEWYSIQKGTTQSFAEILRKKAFKAQLKMWKQRMPGMDISDVYYDAFLLNGKRQQVYPDFKAGEKVRLRIINAAASTYFWLSFGLSPLLVSADGINVHPVSVNKLLHAIAETYDFIFQIPKGRSVEFKAMAQDGSGFVSAQIGSGSTLKAPDIPKPDLIQQMKQMGEHHHGHSLKPMEHALPSDQQSRTDHESHSAHQSNGILQSHSSQESCSDHSCHSNHESHFADSSVKEFSYEDLKSLQKTSFSQNKPVREITFHLKGNMRRYVWNMNGKTLSESDKIQVKKGEVLRMTLNNTTMMHHPMHLHGHFFRVLNSTGEFSPLKHTVDVPPMGKVLIEFEPQEEGDWFFHCHVLYHMKQGMSRVFSYGERDVRLKNYPLSHVWDADRQWFKWGTWTLMSNRFDGEFVAANTRNQLNFGGTFSWVDNWYELRNRFEVDLSYQHFIDDFFRLYMAVEVESPVGVNWLDIRNADISVKLGFRYLLPYLLDLTLSMDQKSRLEIGLDYELLIFARWELFAEGAWAVNLKETFFPSQDEKWQEYEWSMGMHYTMTKNLSLVGSYDNHFSWGIGIEGQF